MTSSSTVQNLSAALSSSFPRLLWGCVHHPVVSIVAIRQVPKCHQAIAQWKSLRTKNPVKSPEPCCILLSPWEKIVLGGPVCGSYRWFRGNLSSSGFTSNVFTFHQVEFECLGELSIQYVTLTLTKLTGPLFVVEDTSYLYQSVSRTPSHLWSSNLKPMCRIVWDF